MQTVDLTNTKSWDEVVSRCKDFVAKNNPSFITGRGWDQNDWPVKNFPTNDELNSLFPEISVLLKRVDGHVAIVNDKALELAQINIKIYRGELIKSGNKLTGALMDNAVELVQKKLPKPDRASITKSLLMAKRFVLI